MLLAALSQLKIKWYSLIQYGTISSSNAVNKTLRSLLKDCGLDKKNYHFHSLRHTHVAYLLAQGIDLYTISKRLGHSDMTITAKRYAYLLKDCNKKQNNKSSMQLITCCPEVVLRGEESSLYRHILCRWQESNLYLETQTTT
mgnify:CR=1 FL=1